MSEWKFLRQKKWKWICAVILIALIKIVTLQSAWVEEFYSTQLYFFFSRFQRILFGWIPFSFGDVLYFLAAGWLLWKVIKYSRLLILRRLSKGLAFLKALNLFSLLAFVYIIFYLFWGINYERKGIAYQLQLTPQSYDTTDLLLIQDLLLQKVNNSKASLINTGEKYPSFPTLVKRAKNSYASAQIKFPFLKYRYTSVKRSFYGLAGDYLGFTGYYNPFTGEAQINTTVPKMLLPYIATHEIAHQMGYAKENEANFVGYLAASNSSDALFRYSTYLDLFLYANGEVYYVDSVASKMALKQLSPPVKKDLEKLKQFDLDHQSVLEPMINWIYGNFLKLNNQPKGLHSYNAVVGMLIAYYKKYGKI